jgi:DNA-binding LytR/AlgR family response regulator
MMQQSNQISFAKTNTSVMRTLIVDDEKHSCESLHLLLSQYEFIQIDDSASSAENALSILVSRPIDLVFLNVELPRKSGFDLVEDLHQLNIYPRIVFITAFQKYAMKAIKCGAFDFLMKPFDRDDLHELIVRLTKEKSINKEMPFKIKNLLNILKEKERIRFNTRHGFVLIEPDDIQYIKAEWNYSTIYLRNFRTELLSINLGNIEKLLPKANFFRISRSVIINLDCLSRVDRKAKTCEIKTDVEILCFPVSSPHLKELNLIT